MPSAEEFVKKFSEVSPFPRVVAQLTNLINDADSTVKQFEDIIQMDPVLVVRVLKLVNSSAFSLMQQVDSIGRAIAFLGIRNLHNLAVTESLHGMFGEDSKSGSNFSRKQLWLHSATTALTSKLVAERIFGQKGDEAYLCAILHDIGIIVEAQVSPNEFYHICEECSEEASFTELEQKVFKTDHRETGYLITKQWNMPPEVPETILAHHNDKDKIAPNSLVGIVQISEYLVAQLGYTMLANGKPHISPYLTSHIQENMDEYEVLLEDLPEELEIIQQMYP